MRRIVGWRRIEGESWRRTMARMNSRLREGQQRYTCQQHSRCMLCRMRSCRCQLHTQCTQLLNRRRYCCGSCRHRYASSGNGTGTGDRNRSLCDKNQICVARNRFLSQHCSRFTAMRMVVGHEIWRKYLMTCLTIAASI